eukprot:scaffold18839_cov35-Prasinocladus_malaysianus.AAC.1
MEARQRYEYRRADSLDYGVPYSYEYGETPDMEQARGAWPPGPWRSAGGGPAEVQAARPDP